MKLKNKTFNLITLEVSKSEITEKGFERIWDEIREQYSAIDYDMEKVTESEDEMSVFIELKYKKDLKSIGF